MNIERDSNKVGVVQMNETLWRCRDFELKHLWQRSVFLSAFLILCFTAYGVLIVRMFDTIGVDKVAINNPELRFFMQNNVALVLCIIGAVFSAMWIMMAKGSKAWYERYERALHAFSQDPDFIEERILDVYGFQIENIKGYDRPAVDNFLLSAKGGGYSPSQINVAVGQVALILWLLLFGMHLCLNVCGFPENVETQRCIAWLILLVGVLVFFLFSFLVVVKKWMRSSVISEYVEEE